MIADRLNADDLLRVLADAWRASGRSEDFRGTPTSRSESSLRRLTDDMPEGTAVVIESIGPALLVVSADRAALVRLTDRGAETTFLGELVGGTLRETEEQIDARHSAITMRFEHQRIPGGFVEHMPSAAQQLECRIACARCCAAGARSLAARRTKNAIATY